MATLVPHSGSKEAARKIKQMVRQLETLRSQLGVIDMLSERESELVARITDVLKRAARCGCIETHVE